MDGSSPKHYKVYVSVKILSHLGHGSCEHRPMDLLVFPEYVSPLIQKVNGNNKSLNFTRIRSPVEYPALTSPFE